MLLVPVGACAPTARESDRVAADGSASGSSVPNPSLPASATEGTGTGATSPGSTALPPQPGEPPPVARPVEVHIPAIGVRSNLEALAVGRGGELEAPSEWNVAGWYAAGPAPGERGPAVIAGHVDSPTGPAVFWRLDELRPGDRIEITRADGSTGAFRVDHSRSVPRDNFPTSEVYGPVPDVQLRLITCDGGYDHSAGRYLRNLVVFATAVDA